MTDEELLQIIKQAAREGRTRLDLSDKNLKALPPEIGQLTNINTLLLGDNLLTLLPPEIGQLTSLSTLELQHNRLETLPPEIGQLTSISQLFLIGNQLTTLPPEIGQLTTISQLFLGGNQLTTLPLEIGQLTNLRTLDLSINKFTTLPPEIGRLTKLTELELSKNQLTTLLPEIAQLANLSGLYLYINRLTTLPSEIGQLTNLQTLDLGGNQLTTLPLEVGQLTQLSTLDLSYNQLTMLPQQLLQLKQLQTIDLRGNALPIPPEVLGVEWGSLGAPATILHYYFQLQQEQKRSLNEAKLLVVGQSNVGKTSLVKRLIEGVFNQHECKTEGIQIQRWQLPVKEQTIRLNVWDFGGQEIMHATHQFFLTKRSLYLLVLNARQDEDENRLEYWLKIIQSFGGTSPIIIVGNQVDQQPLDIDRRGLQTKYPQIQAIVETSCETGQGIDKLRSLITQKVDALEHIYDPLPLSWFMLKQQLEAIEHDYIPYTEYQQLCNTQGITDDLSQTTLVGFLHDLGIVLNFYGDDRLEDTNVLNPQWVTNGVYRILNDNQLITEYRGILERSHLTRILDASRYPRSKHLFIIDMMRKFELCFDLEGFHDQKFLLPDLLTKEEPFTGDWHDALPFQYHYKVLPTSILSRFIVRMNDKIHQHTYWRNGVVLAYEGNIALIKADREDKKIFIRVTGTEHGRRRFLTVIRAQFAAIHQTIPGLDVDEKIPLPNHSEIEPIDYLHLLTLEELGETSFIPTGLKERVSVQSLLDGIESVQERRGKRDRPDGTVNVRPRPSISEPRDQIFVSYSHQDKEWLGKLQIHLKPLIRKHQLAVWDDTKIAAGAEWYKEIETALATAKVAVLLVSPNFLASDFIHDEELPSLLDAAATDGLTVIWIHLSHSAYRDTDISKYQAAHEPSQPLNSLTSAEQDRVLVSICQTIKAAMT
ncbi:COR domain-containing protein [Stenomitos frigidus]|uniref:non-specific serine/threonine protein kinase n=1 Tax=Stenomitos frigidus ULC18 TaxID=2107698 RepID=A0A2T1ESH5_9CYAN|nr:COR domain-containing protein [Stenomitos frigidus]PSB35710.1 GTP-binding protein [Stenomitos frigidus ULC18]